MLIIFDLDDTLIATSQFITPIKLQMALEKMVEEGLSLIDPAESLELLKRLDITAPSSKDALAEFLEIVDAPQKFYEIGYKVIYDDFPPDIPVFTTDGAMEVLYELKQSHELAVVTVGQLHLQQYKMKKAGLDTAVFSRIIVTQERDKKPHYEKLVEELVFSPSDVLVCGDRISIDLTPARDLGFKTVQIREGRGLYDRGPQSDVDFSIANLAGLKEVIAKLHF